MESLLTHNLRLLPHPLREQMSGEAGKSDGAPGYCVTRSRSGQIVTGRIDGNRERFFHSTYDPQKEAERLATGVATPTVFVLGFGSGHHLATLLDRAEHVIVIEPDLHSVLHAMQEVDLTAVLSRANLSLIIGEATGRLGKIIPDSYLPVIHGSASVTALPGRTQADPQLFATIKEELRSALSRTADDFAVQARFGRLWMRNTIQNLATITSPVPGTDNVPLLSQPNIAGRHVIVTAAGPSLDDSVKRLSERGDAVLLATDTSLATLIGAGVVPEAVMTVDCQPISYLHYLTAGFPDTLLVADLAVPPSVLRRHRRLCPVVSPHPFHQLLGVVGGNLSGFDSSGGNVTHAAVSFAIALGAASIQVIGADFAYPHAQGYARGSYVDAHFGAQATRTQPMASGLYHFVWNRPGIYRDAEEPTTLRQPALDTYATALSHLAQSTNIPVTIGPAGAASADGPPEGTGGLQGAAPREIIVPPDILNRLKALLVSAGDAGWEPSEWMHSERRAATAALLPLVAWYRRKNPDEAVGTLLQLAQRETVELLTYFAAS